MLAVRGIILAALLAAFASTGAQAADGAVTIERSLVQIEDHLDHFAGRELCWSVVLFKRSREVAKVASNTKRTRNECHRRIEL